MKYLFNIISTVTNMVQKIRRQLLQVWIDPPLCVVASSHRDELTMRTITIGRFGH